MESAELKEFAPEVQIKELKDLIDAGLVANHDLAFTKSLVSQFHVKGALSPKQWFWVRKSISRALRGR